MNGCDQENRLTPYLLGDLAETEAADFSRHLAGCTACQKCAAEISPVLHALSDGLAKDNHQVPRFDLHHQLDLLCVPPESTHRVLDWFSRSRPWLVAAASALVVTGLSYFLLFSSMHSRYYLGTDVAGTGASQTADASGWFARGGAPSIARFQCVDQLQLAPADSLSDGLAKDAGLETHEGAPAMFFGQMAGAPVTIPPLATPAEPSDQLVESPGLTINGIGNGLIAPPPAFATLGNKTRLNEAASSHFKMKGLYAGRTEGGRQAALKEYDKKDIDDRATDTSYFDESKASTEAKPASPPRRLVKTEVQNRKRVLFDFAEIDRKTLPVAASSADGDILTTPTEIPALEKAGRGEVKNCTVPAGMRDILACSGGLLSTNGMMLNASVSDAASAKPREPRRAQAFNPFMNTAENHFSTFAIDVSTASYNLTRQALRAGSLPDPEVVRTEEIVNAFDYGDVAPDHTTFRVYVEGAPSAFGAPGLTMLRIGVKGKRLGREEQRPAMLTFLLDTSGSMAQPDRMGRARTALRLLLAQLAPVDKIQLISFDDKARLILSPTPASQPEAILAAFDRLQCNGSTNLEDGMRRAYEQAAKAFVAGGENRVILISDGVANLGADNAQDILREVEAFRKQGITCSVFGVGEGTYNDAMLIDLAHKGQGVYRFLDSDDEVKHVFVDELAATLNHIASDVKIQVDWSTEAVLRFRALGYERRLLTAEQFRDDAVEAGEVGSGQAVTALYELELSPAARQVVLGTVHVRYRRVDTGAIEEITQEITLAMIAPALQGTRPQFRLAMGAAALAERLRGSPYVVREYADVARLLRPVAQELSLDPRVKELVSLVDAAEGLSK